MGLIRRCFYYLGLIDLIWIVGWNGVAHLRVLRKSDASEYCYYRFKKCFIINDKAHMIHGSYELSHWHEYYDLGK